MEQNNFNGSSEESQLTALEDADSKGGLQISSSPEQEVLMSVREYLPGNMQEAVAADIKRLDARQKHTIAELKNNGNLPAEAAKKSEQLMAGRKINADGLTIRQVNQVYDFVMELTDTARYEKGARLYRMLNEAVSRENVRALRSYSGIRPRRFDETPDYGDYDNADDFDRTGYQRTKIKLASLRERYSEEKYIFESGDADNGNYTSEHAGKDEFSRKIGKIAIRHFANMRNDETRTDDNTDVMYNRDLEHAIHSDNDEEYIELNSNGDLVYGIFTDDDLAFAEEKIELRRDIGNPAINDLHLERLREVYTSGTISDVFDQLDANYIEEVIGENRLTAKSAVALGFGAIERAVASKNINSAKIHALSKRVESLCRQLLNISSNPQKDIKEKFEERGAGVWAGVNNGVKNLRIIDDLLQYTQELVVLLDLQNDDDRILLNG